MRDFLEAVAPPPSRASVAETTAWRWGERTTSDERLSSVGGWSCCLWCFRSELLVLIETGFFGCLLFRSFLEGLLLSLLLLLLSALLPLPAVPVSRPDEESFMRFIAPLTRSPPSGESLVLCWCTRQLYLLTFCSLSSSSSYTRVCRDFKKGFMGYMKAFM